MKRNRKTVGEWVITLLCIIIILVASLATIGLMYLMVVGFAHVTQWAWVYLYNGGVR